MDKVVEILEKMGEEFERDGAVTEVDSVGGSIFEVEGVLYFVHGNMNFGVPADNPAVEAYVKAYLGGFDAFAEFLEDRGVIK